MSRILLVIAGACLSIPIMVIALLSVMLIITAVSSVTDKLTPEDDPAPFYKRCTTCRFAPSEKK